MKKKQWNGAWKALFLTLTLNFFQKFQALTLSQDKMGNFKPDLLLKFFGFDPPFNSQHQKKCLPGPIPLLFFYGSPIQCPKGLSLKFGVNRSIAKKVMRPKFSNFDSLQRPLMASEVNQIEQSFIRTSRGFQNGMTLAYWIKIEVSRASRSFKSVLTRFGEKVEASRMASQRSEDFSNGVRGCPQVY